MYFYERKVFVFWFKFHQSLFLRVQLTLGLDNVLALNRLQDIIQYIPRNMHTVFALLCFVVVIHWLIFPYPSGLLHWHCGNLTIAPVPAKQPWWIWINTSCEFIMNDCKTTTKQSTTKPCAYFLGYTVWTNEDPIHWRIYAELGGDELKQKHAKMCGLNHLCKYFLVPVNQKSIRECISPLGVKPEGGNQHTGKNWFR